MIRHVLEIAPIRRSVWRLKMHRVTLRATSFLVALAAALGLLTRMPAPQAEDLVDLTITFEGAVHGEIAPCG
jgi:hypothetical protein